MVVIRCSRHGAKKRAFYHIVVTDSRMPRDGRYIERVGFFDSVAANLKLERPRIEHWIAQGAQMSDRVRSLVKKHDKNIDLAAEKAKKIEHTQAKKAAQIKAAADKVAKEAAEAAAAEEKAAKAEAEKAAAEAAKAKEAEAKAAEEAKAATDKEAPAAEQSDTPAKEEPTAEKSAE